MIAESNTPVGLASAIAALLHAPPDRQAARTYAEGFGWDAVSAGQIAVFRAACDHYDASRATPGRLASDSPRLAR